jgi:hypothetical protein
MNMLWELRERERGVWHYGGTVTLSAPLKV